MDAQDRASADEWLSSRNDVMTVYRDAVDDDRDHLFPLRYVRAGYESDYPPIMILPGGPGVASVFPYELVRRLGASKGMDILMMEHRGVGMSRSDARGTDLPLDAMRVNAVLEDMLAVLDHARIEKAVLYGTSYGGYLAQRFALAHPDRVHSLVLDSPFTSVADEAAQQHALRSLFWYGENDRTESVARVIRRLVEDGTIPVEESGPVIAAVHQYGGLSSVRDIVDLLVLGRGRLTWTSVYQALAATEALPSTPFVLERDFVDRIASTELGFGHLADGQPLDPLALTALRAKEYEPFAGEAFDLERERTAITAPTLVITGERDLMIPASRSRLAAEQIPGARFLSVPGLGHSLLDSHAQLALMAAMWTAAGAIDPFLEKDTSSLKRIPVNELIARGITAALLAERHSPVRLWAGRRRGPLPPLRS
ncbi:alpha/beta hydrolase [Helcobacillus massiliensis]|uniref:alpha/beta hydrolase n=1 Tax=Helcobacillus massiliensis TaxID=521392 RepID=UPI0021A78F0D|nr:alpha/beta hydrolase [Helcobacillus massiliensis]MCT1557733.1 alpha/beta hydrolase [Helcobacillus massiliensis]MCT2036005.1 alpha/beta hydrolase [Helcobacillus massiliensis]MCT2331725.1 alpha/beta hydrolase [Helcobacillus massiliensis]